MNLSNYFHTKENPAAVTLFIRKRLQENEAQVSKILRKPCESHKAQFPKLVIFAAKTG